MMQHRRIGDYLVEQSLLTASERDEVLRLQEAHPRPFGVIAEERFGVKPADVERAWATQLADLAPRVDLSSVEFELGAVESIERRQAWQFRVVPFAYSENMLQMCTTRAHLPRALRFAMWRIDGPCELAVADQDELADALMRWFPLEGMGPSVVRTGGAEVFENAEAG
ncbi:MAG: hypothetical protein AAGB51_08640 [Planctomycetota bacterium]